MPGRGLRRRGSLVHATRAGRSCLERSHYHPEDVAVMINAGVYRDRHYAEPAFACFIQDKLGINTEFQGRQTLSFDLQNGGCGLLSAAHVVSNMIQGGLARVGMIIASEANADRRPDPTWCYQASGAAAILDVAPSASVGFGPFAFRTFDAHLDQYSACVSLAQKGGKLLLRKDAAVEQSYLQAAPVVWRELLAQDGSDAGSIDLLIPAQISTPFLDGLADALGFPRAKVVDLTRRCGDTLSTSWLLALAHARETGLAREGTRAVIMAFGSGITVGAARYDF